MLMVKWTHLVTGEVRVNTWRCSQYGPDRSDAEEEADVEGAYMSVLWRETERIYIP